MAYFKRAGEATLIYAYIVYVTVIASSKMLYNDV
jgi:hypothetical protein